MEKATMEGAVLCLFLVAAFAGGFASGLAGFAMGFVVSGIWLHFLTPIQTTALIVGYGLLTQGYGVWKLRHALSWQTIAPFIIGGAIGIPIGTMLLTYINPAHLRSGVGVLLIVYGSYGLAQPALKPVPANVSVNAGIGLMNGMVAGLTGLPGFIITVWCQLRGWSKDLQRAVFQPVMLAASATNLLSLGIMGAVSADTLELYALGLPAMAAGLWVGFKLYGRLDDAAFRKIILVLLVFSGLGLIAAHGSPSIAVTIDSHAPCPCLPHCACGGSAATETFSEPPHDRYSGSRAGLGRTVVRFDPNGPSTCMESTMGAGRASFACHRGRYREADMPNSVTINPWSAARCTAIADPHRWPA
jgi:hypothetical protein